MAAQTQIPSDARFDATKKAVVDGQGNVIEGLEHIKDEQTFNDEKAKQAETVE